MSDIIDINDLLESFDSENPGVRERLNQYYREVGQRVTRAMKAQRIRNEELVLHCGVLPLHIRNVRSGTPGYVHGKIIGLIAQALGMKAEELWGTPPDSLTT